MRIEVSKEMLGTVFEVSLICDEHANASVLVEKIFAEGLRIEKAYSRFIDNNELYELNNRVGEWASISDELFELLKFGAEVHTKTYGAFDMSVKNILDSWGYDKNYSFKVVGVGDLNKIPNEGLERIEFDEKNKKVKIPVQVDLGGFGKGYAIDRMAEILRAEGTENFCINGGGDIYAVGLDEGNVLWKIHFGHPVNTDEAIGWVEVDGFACCSSNPVRRKWDDKHHLVDPKTGKPANEMLAVYTQAKSTMVADAYSTALFAMGYEKAKEWLRECPERDLDKKISVEAMIVSPAGKIYRSGNFKGALFE